MSINSTGVLAQIKKQYDTGSEFTARDLKPKEEDLHATQNALWRLAQGGYLDKVKGKGSKGKYILRGRKAPTKTNGKSHSTDPEQVIIDELLDCMARAEPILKKWSAIREALKGI